MESIHELLANDLVNASVPICWETHITAFNSAGEQISGGVAGDMCSGEQKIRGNRKSGGTHISATPYYASFLTALSWRFGTNQSLMTIYP